MRPFRFGVQSSATTLAEWQATARRAEGLGYATLVAQDHFGNQLAPLPALVAAAAVTTRLRLGTLVLDNDFRHPALLAKEAATVDVLSDGRLELGLGAGWQASDYTTTGQPFDPPATRIARLAESVRILEHLFASSEPLTFAGEHYRLENLEPLPRPVQQPRPPLMLGGRQKRMLTLAGRAADIVSISLLHAHIPDGPPPPSFAQKVAWVREAARDRADQPELHINARVVEVTDADARSALTHAAAQVRQTVEAVRESPGTLVGSVAAIVETLHARREQWGINYYVIQARYMEAFAPVVARIAGR